MAFAIGVVVCGWPWLVAFRAAKHVQNNFSTVLFAALGASIPLFFANSISSAPAEGVGWYSIFSVLLIWCAYAFTPRYEWPR